MSTIQLKTIIPSLFIALTLLCFTTAPKAFGVSPPPDGGYPGGNTAEGQSALLSRTTGGFNTAVGYLSLRSDTTGSFNTAVGAGTLLANTADSNTATGAGALLSNTTGTNNTATGAFALFANTAGSNNTAAGAGALSNDQSGERNTAFGSAALYSNVSGGSNIAIGFQALLNSTGNSNTALGDAAGFSVINANNVICIGADGQNVSNSCYIGNIAGQTVGMGGSTCYVDNDGKLGVFLSARRFKTDIADMATASEAVLRLHPVTFHYKPELDKTGIPQFGLVAEEVAKVNPDLVTRDSGGKLQTVRYEAVNVMLLNEFLKQHRKVEEQEATIAQQQKDFKSRLAWQEKSFMSRLAQQQKQIDTLTVGLEKVSNQLEADKPARQTVANNH
jgi:Chaperone of endosialidase